MTLKVEIVSTYTRRLPQLERLVTLARQQGLSDEATVTTRDDGSIVVAEFQSEDES